MDNGECKKMRSYFCSGFVSLALVGSALLAFSFGRHKGKQEGIEQGIRQSRTSAVKIISRENWMGYPTYTLVDSNHNGEYDTFFMTYKGKISGEPLCRELSKEVILRNSMPCDLEFID